MRHLAVMSRPRVLKTPVRSFCVAGVAFKSKPSRVWAERNCAEGPVDSETPRGSLSTLHTGTLRSHVLTVLGLDTLVTWKPNSSHLFRVLISWGNKKKNQFDHQIGLNMDLLSLVLGSDKKDSNQNRSVPQIPALDDKSVAIAPLCWVTLGGNIYRRGGSGAVLVSPQCSTLGLLSAQYMHHTHWCTHTHLCSECNMTASFSFPFPIQITWQSWSGMKRLGDVGWYELKCQ